jgi:quercetin dioxygenase-like cupin family protein
MTDLVTPAARVRLPEQVEQRWFYGGGVQRWLATAEDTGGAYLLFSDVMEQGKRTPLHTHPAEESLYVVDGSLLVHLDGDEHRVDAGGLVIAPREVPHAFLVLP